MRGNGSENIFVINKIKCNVTVGRGNVTIKEFKKNSGRIFGQPFNKIITINHILQVSLKEDVNSTISTKVQKYVLTIYAIEKKKSYRWKLSEINVYSTSQSSLQKCKDEIENELFKTDEFIARPSSLLIFVNPFGGKGRGVEVFETKFKPLLELAQTKTTVITTTHRGHAKRYLEENDLSVYDGIVAVGGDGMLNEIVNGLLMKTQQQNNINVNINDNDMEIHKFATPDIRLGVIPAGSTDCVCYVTNGIIDPTTSALHILVGDSHPLDVTSIHDKNGNLHQFSIAMTAYGFYGDVLRKSETMRWMGPPRYDYAGFQVYLKNKSYPGEIRYIKSETSLQESPLCRSPCSICQTGLQENVLSPADPNAPFFLPPPILNEDSDASVSSDSNSDGIIMEAVGDSVSTGSQMDKVIEARCDFGQGDARPDTLEIVKVDQNSQKWETINGDFAFINVVPMSCACIKSPLGLSPTSHLSDGCFDLVLVEKCSHKQLLQYLLAHKGSADRFRFPFVRAIRVKAFQFKVNPPPSGNNGEEESLSSDSSKRSGRNSFKSVFKRSRSMTTTSTVEVTSFKSKKRCQTFTGDFEYEEPVTNESTSLSTWNSDGEVISDPEITVRIHRGLIKLFCRGIEKNV